MSLLTPDIGVTSCANKELAIAMNLVLVCHRVQVKCQITPPNILLIHDIPCEPGAVTHAIPLRRIICTLTHNNASEQGC